MKGKLVIAQMCIEKVRREGPLSGVPYLDALQEAHRILTGHYNPYYKLFWLLAQELEPRLSVELGSWRGYAACHLAAGYPGGSVVTIDIHREDKLAQQMCHAHGKVYPNFTYINAWTWDAAPHIGALHIPIDILYIDAWHEYKYVRREWELYEPLLADDALVIADDLFDSPGTTEEMLRFWNELDYPKFVDGGFLHDGIPFGFLAYERVR